MKRRVKRENEFTREMRKSHTIYMPQMLHYHNELLCAAFRYGGYKLDVVPEYNELAKEVFSLVGKDYCTCAIGIVGNLITFLKGLKEQDSVAFLEPQAGGACRAGNYYNLIVESLKKLDYKKVPVLSLNFHGEEAHSGFRINGKMLVAAVAAVCYGDLLMCLTQQIRPYELNKGQTESLRKKWVDELAMDISKGKGLFSRKKNYRRILQSFSDIPVDRSRKCTKVGIVGEIYIKFSPVGNFHLEDFLYENNCELRQGGFINYCAYVVYSEMMNNSIQGKGTIGYDWVLKYINKLQIDINTILESHGYLHDRCFDDMLKVKGQALDEHYNIGDGWLMSAEAVDLAEQGYQKILIVHPFGCLVSHIGGRGVIKYLNSHLDNAKVTSVEFDYDQSKTLRESRILLAIS